MAKGILPVQSSTSKVTSLPSKIVDQHIPCPSCPSSDAYCTYDDGHGYCFSCNYYKPKEGKGTLEEGFSYEYLEHRGILKSTFEFYESKTKIDKDGKPISIGFKYPNGSYKVRELPKGFHTLGGSTSTF